MFSIVVFYIKISFLIKVMRFYDVVIVVAAVTGLHLPTAAADPGTQLCQLETGVGMAEIFFRAARNRLKITDVDLINSS
jgi:hypothetical protein